MEKQAISKLAGQGTVEWMPTLPLNGMFVPQYSKNIYNSNETLLKKTHKWIDREVMN